jgi:hypothetical protein
MAENTSASAASDLLIECVSLSRSPVACDLHAHARTYTHVSTHARTHARTHAAAHTHARTHQHPAQVSVSMIVRCALTCECTCAHWHPWALSVPGPLLLCRSVAFRGSVTASQSPSSQCLKIPAMCLYLLVSRTHARIHTHACTHARTLARRVGLRRRTDSEIRSKNHLLGPGSQV